MILTKWIEKVGYAVISDGIHECAVSASSPLALQQFVDEHYDIKKHDAALLIKYKESRYVLIIENRKDIPFSTVYDPDTGKPLLLYEIDEQAKSLVRIT